MSNTDAQCLEDLQKQIESLKDQVKKLSAGELHQYDLQMRLDYQLKTQEEIIHLGHRLQTVHSEHEIALLVARSLVEHFDYEKSLFCLWDDSLQELTLAGKDGYYEEPEPESAREFLLDLLETVSKHSAADILIENNMPQPVMVMDKRVLIFCRMGDQGKVLGIMVFGNSRERSAYHRSIDEQDRPLWKTIQRIAASALENARLYAQLELERLELRRAHDDLRSLNDELEAIVQKRTAELAESREEYRRLYLESERTGAKYRTLLDSSADPIVVYDEKWRPVFLNSAFGYEFGWNLDEIKSKTMDFVPKGGARDLQDLKTRVLAGSKISNLESQRMTRDGRLREVSISAAAHFDEHGGFAGSIFHIRDITSQKKMEEELLKIRKLESIGLLAGGLAHDFNNMLSGILLNIQMAQVNMAVGKDIARYLKSVESVTEKAAKLTQQLLTFAKGGAPVKKAVAIEKFIMEAVEFVLRGSKVRCEYAIGSDLPMVELDEGQMSQVVYNLIVNAQQAMAYEGVIRICLQKITPDELGENKFLQTMPDRDFVRISIQDTGIGIPEEHLDKIFDPYFTTKEKGSGLGLAISHSIINKHQGFLTAESGKGLGATFAIYLPAYQLRPTEIRPMPGHVAEKLKGGAVLVMDDEEIIRELLTEMLKQMGYRADSSKDGQEAIDLYLQAAKAGKPYDIVIMDLTISGGMGGKETMAALRKLAPQVKAVVSSGYSNDPVMSEFEKYGFCGVLKKPYTMQELEILLNSIQ